MSFHWGIVHNCNNCVYRGIVHVFYFDAIARSPDADHIGLHAIIDGNSPALP